MVRIEWRLGWGKASLTSVARNGTIDVPVKGELTVYVLLAD